MHVFKGTITTVGAAAYIENKQVIFKNCVHFINCIAEIDK